MSETASKANIATQLSPMKAGRYHAIVLIGILGLFANSSFGQTGTNALVKAGGFIYFLHSQYNGFSTHVELEKAFKRAEFLTSGPRLDYVNFDYSPSDLMLAYDLKLYPFYWIKKKPYHGMFIGVDVTYLLKTNDIHYSRFGPGVGALLGYQHVFKDKFFLSLEGSMIYVQDLNDKAPQHNAAHRYLYVFACIKGGWKISGIRQR